MSARTVNFARGGRTYLLTYRFEAIDADSAAQTITKEQLVGQFLYYRCRDDLDGAKPGQYRSKNQSHTNANVNCDSSRNQNHCPEGEDSRNQSRALIISTPIQTNPQ